MSTPVTIDLRHVARGLAIPLRQVQAVVELLDEGNTVPFITRYRKDRTGGLDEEQIRQVQGRLTKARLLAERKQTILRSIEAQGKWTEELAQQIHAATTTKRLEDLYLPFRPKKQTLATSARARGLEPLAREILAADPACVDLDARARDFVNADRQVPTAADALLGAGHIIAEQFSEQADLRQRLREILQRTGSFVSGPAAVEQKPFVQPPGGGEAARRGTTVPARPAKPPEAPALQPEAAAGADQAPALTEPQLVQLELPLGRPQPPLASTTAPAEPQAGAEVGGPGPPSEFQAPAVAAEPTAAAAEAPQSPPPETPHVRPPRPPAPARLSKKELKKQQLEERQTRAFRDYFDYREEIRRIPPHRLLAINRGERARVLRVRIECDLAAMHAAIEEMLIPPGHAHADYLRGCARDALQRLILPGLEREIRRELTDRAETHAVGVFAKNLRNLLLQPPVRDRRILAIDPGFKSGCKLVALDQFGNVLEHGVVFLIGRPERRQQAKQKVVDLVTRDELSLIAIGNGTACRSSEDFIAELLAAELQGRGISYVIVNEAGASAYSTSHVGREEFPQFDASVRGAISIGRRLQDPLSELVKIEPANIGVGLYQHDVKAKHLAASLDEVVQSCVNYVGVELNTASPALLRYVSGLNQLTARRVYEYRREHGPFRLREQLREVPGVGEATFVQAAGFLRIPDGSQPLDATWIHPESYEIANQVLEKFGCTAEDLRDRAKVVELSQQVAGADRAALAGQLAVGTHNFSDILAQLARPGRDPREDLPAPVFKQGVLKLEDLTAGMELTGTVLNVVDFGAFVDIGMHDSGLVHVSQLADRYVRDPHEVVVVGDIVKVWVLEVDKQRRRVSLTMIRPGTERQRRPPRAARPGGPPTTEEGKPLTEATGSTAGAAPPAGARPPRPAGAGRPPQRRGPPSQGRGPPPQHRGPPRPKYQGPRSRPKPFIPITDAMKTGKEPLRTFGDLKQFYEHKQKGEADEPTPTPPATAQGVPAAGQDAAPTTEATPALTDGLCPTPEQAAPTEQQTPTPPAAAAAPPEQGQAIGAEPPDGSGAAAPPDAPPAPPEPPPETTDEHR